MKKFKVRCISVDPGKSFTKGKVYNVENGRIYFDKGVEACGVYKNVEQMNAAFISQFELVKKEPLKVGDYVVTKKKAKFKKGFEFLDIMRVEIPIQVESLTANGNIELDNGYYYAPKWLKKVNPPIKAKGPTEIKGEVKELLDKVLGDKKVFNIDDYDTGTVMHCDTQEKADRFCGYLQSIGIKQDCNDCWHVYGNETCLEVKETMFGSKEWHREQGYIILEFDDFIFEAPKVEEYKGFIDGETIHVYEVSYDRVESFTFHMSNKVLNWHIDNGYAFKTKEEAERKREVMNIVDNYKHEFSLEDWQDGNVQHWFVICDHKNKKLDRDSYFNLYGQRSEICFKSKEDCWEAREAIGYEDWCKYVLNLR